MWINIKKGINPITGKIYVVTAYIMAVHMCVCGGGSYMHKIKENIFN